MSQKYLKNGNQLILKMKIYYILTFFVFLLNNNIYSQNEKNYISLSKSKNEYILSFRNRWFTNIDEINYVTFDTNDVTLLELYNFLCGSPESGWTISDNCIYPKRGELCITYIDREHVKKYRINYYNYNTYPKYFFIDKSQLNKIFQTYLDR